MMGPTQKLNLKLLQVQIHQNAKDKGFWESQLTYQELVTKLALIASEVFESINFIRSASEASSLQDHNRRELSAELADIIIRTLDFAEGLGLDLGEAIEKKMAVNKDRPYKHGKRF